MPDTQQMWCQNMPFFFLFYFFVLSKEGFTAKCNADGLKTQAAPDQILVLVLVVSVTSYRHGVALRSDLLQENRLQGMQLVRSL